VSRPDRAPAGYVTTPGGNLVLAKTLVEEMRRFRGRLTVPNLCRAMGWPATAKNYGYVYKICMRWEIETAEFVPVPRTRSVNQMRQQSALELAASQRMEQIRLAKEEAATGKIPPYNPPVHLWWKETVG
jgi:hypothetical protein